MGLNAALSSHSLSRLRPCLGCTTKEYLRLWTVTAQFQMHGGIPGALSSVP